MAAEKSGPLDGSLAQTSSFFQGQVDTVTDLKKNTGIFVIKNKHKKLLNTFFWTEVKK